MSIDEFNNTRFGAGMKCTYKGQEYDIATVDFDEALIGLSLDGDEEYPCWVRCENVDLITPKP